MMLRSDFSYEVLTCELKLINCAAIAPFVDMQNHHESRSIIAAKGITEVYIGTPADRHMSDLYIVAHILSVQQHTSRH